jgi:uridine kinase
MVRSGKQSFVVAISGPSGCGKTTLVKAVAEQLGDAAMMFFDDFVIDDPPDIEEWGGKPGADYSR